MIRTTAILLSCGLAAPAFAESHASGDAAAGEEAFKQCQTCHVVVDGDGNKIAGRNAKTGPNLYAMAGRQAGTVEGFRYGKHLVEAGEAGLMWDEENFVAYLQDTKAFLRETLDDPKARSKMTFKVRGDGGKSPEEVAKDLYAFLAGHGMM